MRVVDQAVDDGDPMMRHACDDATTRQFIGAKKKNVTPEQELVGWGDAWT